MANKNKVSPTSFLTILFLVLALVSIFVIITRQLSKQNHNQVTKNLPATDEFSDWKTYKNEEYGFELRYPPDWEFRQSSQTYVQPRNIEFSLSNKNNNEWMGIVIYLDPQISNQGFGTNLTHKKIGGVDAKEMYFTTPGDDVAVPKSKSPIGIWVEKDDKIYALLFYNTDKITNIYDQILSTFKFIDSKTNNGTYCKEDGDCFCHCCQRFIDSSILDENELEKECPLYSKQIPYTLTSCVWDNCNNYEKNYIPKCLNNNCTWKKL